MKMTVMIMINERYGDCDCDSDDSDGYNNADNDDYAGEGDRESVDNDAW